MRKWTDAELQRAVQVSHTFSEVARRLNLSPNSGSAGKHLKKHILRLGLDTSHFGYRPPRGWSDLDLEDAVHTSHRLSEVCDKLGLVRGGNYPALKEHIQRLGLSIEHFCTDLPAPGNRVPLDEVLVGDRYCKNTHGLKKRLIREGVLEPVCSGCGIRTWLGKPLSLHLEHKDGDRSNNQIENLCLLCPNCHSLTETYCGKNKGHPNKTK